MNSKKNNPRIGLSGFAESLIRIFFILLFLFLVLAAIAYPTMDNRVFGCLFGLGLFLFIPFVSACLVGIAFISILGSLFGCLSRSLAPKISRDDPVDPVPDFQSHGDTGLKDGETRSVRQETDQAIYEFCGYENLPELENEESRKNLRQEYIYSFILVAFSVVLVLVISVFC